MLGSWRSRSRVRSSSRNKPFLWTVDGRTTSPWLLAFFDRNFYESGVDLFFNALLFPGRSLALPSLSRGDEHGSPARAHAGRDGGALGSASVVQALVLAGFVPFPESRPKEVSTPPGQAGAVFPLLPYAPSEPDLAHVRAPLSSEHPLGTDNVGATSSSRLVYGTRISLTIGLFAVSLYVTFGTILGALAGYYGGPSTS